MRDDIAKMAKEITEREDFHDTIEDVITRFLYVCSLTNDDTLGEDCLDFLAMGYHYRGQEFLQHAVVKFAPDFDLWQEIFSRLPQRDRKTEFFISLLDCYNKDRGEENVPEEFRERILEMKDDSIFKRMVKSFFK